MKYIVFLTVTIISPRPESPATLRFNTIKNN